MNENLSTDFDDFREFWQSVFGETEMFADGGTVSGTTSSTSGSGVPTWTGRSMLNLFRHDIYLGKYYGFVERKLPHMVAKDLMVKTLKLQYDRIHKGKRHAVSDWFQLLVVAHSNSDAYKTEYQEYIQKTETQFYDSPTSVQPLDTSTKTIQLFLHIIRAHRHAEAGDWQTAGAIFDGLTYEWMDFDESKQTNVLFHAFVHAICNQEWKKSLDLAKRMWAITRNMDSVNRYNWGAWDDWFLVNIVQWWFAQYIPEYASLLETQAENTMGYHKKWLLLTLGPELIKLVPAYYYAQARSLNSELPEMPIAEEISQ